MGKDPKNSVILRSGTVFLPQSKTKGIVQLLKINVFFDITEGGGSAKGKTIAKNVDFSH